jgi:hypothetical protein
LKSRIFLIPLVELIFEQEASVLSSKQQVCTTYDNYTFFLNKNRQCSQRKLDLSSHGVRNPVGCFKGLSLNKSQIGLWPSVYFCFSSTTLTAFKTMRIDARRIVMTFFFTKFH